MSRLNAFVVGPCVGLLFALTVHAQGDKRKKPPDRKPPDKKPIKPYVEPRPAPRPPKPAAVVVKNLVSKDRRQNEIVEKYRITTYGHNWNGRQWVRESQPDVRFEFVRRPAPHVVQRPFVNQQVYQIPQDRWDGVPTWAREYPRAYSPQQWEVDTRIRRAWNRRQANPSPYTQQMFLGRRTIDSKLMDIYRVVTYNHRQLQTGWIPFAARDQIIQRPVIVGEGGALPPFDPAGLQDQLFWGNFDPARAGVEPRQEDVLGLPQGDGQGGEEAPPMEEYRSKYIALENPGLRAVDVSLHFETMNRDKDWQWVKPLDAQPRRIRLAPGEATVLFDTDRRVHARRLRIWAEEVGTRKKWDDYREKDYWLVAEKDGERLYKSPRMLFEKVSINIK